MQGRKPKPTALKLLAGNPGKRAINHAEPKPRVVMPKPPEHLSDAEKDKWKSTVRELHPLGLVTAIDKDALAMYCTIYVRWVKAEKMVRDKGEKDMISCLTWAKEKPSNGCWVKNQASLNQASLARRNPHDIFSELRS